jgi:hypothetical protein
VKETGTQNIEIVAHQLEVLEIVEYFKILIILTEVDTNN